LPGEATRGPGSTRPLSEESPVSPAPTLDAGFEVVIERSAAHILGPIAHHLARTVGARATSPRELAEALAAFMPQSGEREAFLRGVTPSADERRQIWLSPPVGDARQSAAGRRRLAPRGQVRRLPDRLPHPAPHGDSVEPARQRLDTQLSRDRRRGKDGESA